MKMLLTGGAGYIGSACLRWLLKNGHDPVAYDNLSSGNRSAVVEDRLIVGDVLNRDELVGALRDSGAEVVLHFAAVASVPESIQQPELYWRTNVIGTKNVLDAMREVDVHKILFSSTASVYSFDSPMPLTEESPVGPRVPYGTTKHAAERIIKDYARAHDMAYCILRYFNASGADPDGQFGEDRPHETHLLPLILFTALDHRNQLEIYGGDWDTRDGTCVRDFIHTDDLAQAHQLAAERLEPGMGETYNVSTGTGTTVLEAVRACEEIVGQSIPHKIVGRRPGDPGVLFANPAKLKRETGWTPKYPEIKQIAATAWVWHTSQPDGYGAQI